MVYLFYGTEEYFIQREINKIIDKFNMDPINTNYYNLENTLLKEIIDDACTFSLFSDKKMIIVENSYIFTGTINKKNPTQDLTILEDYLDHINKNSILIFTVIREKIDGRKKITSKIKKIGEVKEFNETKNVEEYVRDMFENYQISSSDIKLFCDRLGNNLMLIEKEIEKLKTYKNNDFNICTNDILDITSKYVSIDIFKLIDDIICQKKEQAIESYDEMMKIGEEPIKIMITLASQIRLMYQAKELSKLGYLEKDISEILKVHPYRVKLAIAKGYQYSSSTLLNYLYELAKMDIDIKSGYVDKNYALEMFILGI